MIGVSFYLGLLSDLHWAKEILASQGIQVPVASGGLSSALRGLSPTRHRVLGSNNLAHDSIHLVLNFL